MQKWIVMMVSAWCLVFPGGVVADECMEGDCDNGYGTGFTDDNKVYEGEWRDGMPHGHGKLFVSKGEVLEGTWEKGELVKEDGEKTDREKKGRDGE